MGLDIVFSRKQAEEAGIEIKIIPNDGIYDDEDDADYVAWCKANSECIKVPNTDHYVVNDSAGTENFMVRANKWGTSYYPLTQWLEANNINWIEC